MEPVNLMLVDDEEKIISTMKRLLEKRGYNVLTAISGDEALKLLEEHTVHVVILDVKMPGKDGIRTLKEIKKRHTLVEVIMLTGHGSVETALDGMKSGAYDYLTKPAGIDVIIGKVNEAFEKIKVRKKKGCDVFQRDNRIEGGKTSRSVARISVN